MANTKNMDLNTLVDCLQGHYKKPDGSPCIGVKDLMQTEAFKTAYAIAVKTAHGDGTAARAAALYSMVEVKEEVESLPAWVINPEAPVFKGRGRDRTSVVDEGGNLVTGVQIALPGGRTRVMQNIDAETTAGLKPGSPITLQGDIKKTLDLTEPGSEKYVLSKSVTVEAGGHNEVFPRMGLDFQLGTKVRENGWGPYRLTKRNTVNGTFHARFDGDLPVYATLDLTRCAWANENGDIGMFSETHDGHEGVVMLTGEWVEKHYGVPSGSDRDAYTEALEGKTIFAHVVEGTILRKLFPNSFGGREVLNTEISDLEAQGLIQRIGKSEKKFLVIPKDAADSQVAEGEYPHVLIGDQKVHDIIVNGEWADVYTMADNGNFTIECIEQEKDKRDGGTWVKNTGGFAVPLGESLGGGGINASKIASDDPVYLALSALDAEDPDAGMEEEDDIDLTASAESRLTYGA